MNKVFVTMAAGLDGSSELETGTPAPLPGSARLRVPMVVGVTSDQTCLVLTGRLCALQHAGFDVTLVASPGELLERTAHDQGISACPIPMERGIAPVADLISLIALVRLLRRIRPVVTDFSTPKAGLLGNLAAWALRVPHRVYTLRGLKLEASQGWKRLLLITAERVAAWCADVVLLNSESLGVESRMLRICPDAKLRMLGDGSSNGVDTVRFSPGQSGIRPIHNIQTDAVVLGFVGRLTRDKGVPELLEAFEVILKDAPSTWLLLVGWFDISEDALHPRWRKLIASHPRIVHTGYVDDPVAYYRAMDMLILPTHREGFPNVALEAAACGLPVITTESTGARDAVLAEVTGLLVPPRTPAAIAEAVLGLIRDKDKRTRMGEAGRQWVSERFSQVKILALAVEFYRDLLEQSPAQMLIRKQVTSQARSRDDV